MLFSFSVANFASCLSTSTVLVGSRSSAGTVVAISALMSAIVADESNWHWYPGMGEEERSS